MMGNVCNKQYNGQTTMALNVRMNLLRSDWKTRKYMYNRSPVVRTFNLDLVTLLSHELKHFWVWAKYNRIYILTKFKNIRSHVLPSTKSDKRRRTSDTVLRRCGQRTKMTMSLNFVYQRAFYQCCHQVQNL